MTELIASTNKVLRNWDTNWSLIKDKVGETSKGCYFEQKWEIELLEVLAELGKNWQLGFGWFIYP